MQTTVPPTPKLPHSEWAMLPRPPSVLRPIARAPARTPWTCPSCLLLARNTVAPRRYRQRALPHTSPFHTTVTYRADNTTLDHYEVLQLSQTASPAEIKRQFFTLSKKHHPDKNPDDPTASTRFVAISEAYHVLSVPEKRAQYDAQLNQSQASKWGRGAHDHPQGSYSSASFAGSRPASGLNKRRSTFRGPPPSFYKAGGYGKHGAKRAEYAHHNPHGGGASSREAGQESYGEYGGFGPGQTRQGSEVPHFDDRRHKETHDHVHEHIYARRRRKRAHEIPEEFERGGMVMNFLLVSGAIGIIGLSAKIFGEEREEKNKRRKETT